MRTVLSTLAALAVVAVLVAGAVAEDDKEVTLKGKITCAKCDLKKEKACATVIVTKESGKDVTYYFDKDSSKKHHKKICTESVEGSVTGVKGKDGDKHTIKVSKVEFKE